MPNYVHPNPTRRRHMATFASILDRPASDIERPKPLPVGTYHCIVKGQPRNDKSTKKQTEFYEFTLQPTAVMDDVDMDDLESMGGFANKTIRATYYITEDAAWRLKKFLEDLGIDSKKKNLRQMVNEAPNKAVLATIKHQASDDGQTVYAQLASTAPAD